MTRIIVEYNLLRTEDAPKLVRSVMNAIRDGWEPLGGAFFTPSVAHSGMYMQAVVRYEEPGSVIPPVDTTR